MNLVKFVSVVEKKMCVYNATLIFNKTQSNNELKKVENNRSGDEEERVNI